ncbi:MAG TPA: NMD3-related protein [Candidatus Nanoarchaeia archaeon]|nr:NMD3-related protein [Candidatus Nanoarchaeia archaeon]
MVRSLEGKHGEYYEAILQLREVEEKVVTFTDQEIRRIKLPVTKVMPVRNGWDYYLADNELTRSLGKTLQQKFGGKLAVTASLFGKKDGKDIYRVTVLFRGLKFSRGQEVIYHGEKCTVKALAKDILLLSSKSGKKIHVRYEYMKDIKVVEE